MGYRWCCSCLVLKMGHVGKGAERWLELGTHSAAAERADEGGAGDGAGGLVQPGELGAGGQPAVPDPAGDRGGGAGAADPEGAQSGDGVHHRGGGGGGVRGGGDAAGGRWHCWRLPLPFLGEFAFKHLHDYQRARITTFLNPESDPLGAGYNIIQSKIALGSGGMWGKGFMQGTQAHLNFLPEKQTDFIFSIVAEEWGLVGALALLGLLLCIILGGDADRVAVPASIWAAAGAGHFGEHLHVCVRKRGDGGGRDPVGGVPLPLVSHGGSAMLTVMFAMGLLMSVHVHRDAVFPTSGSVG